MPLLDATLSALVNVVILAAIPFVVFAAAQRRRHERGLGESAKRAGLQLGESRYIGYCALAALLAVAVVWIWNPSAESASAPGSAFAPFRSLALGPTSIAMALIYGVVQTGFAEEFLFRGLIAGSLSRRMKPKPANVLQALIFLVPHLFILAVAPAMWPVLLVVFAGGLFAGWVRIASGSIIGPWLLHAAVNVSTALGVILHST